MNRYSDFFTDLVSVCGIHEKDIFAVLGDKVCTEDFLRFLYDLYKKGYELGEADARPYGVYGSDLEKVKEVRLGGVA